MYMKDEGEWNEVNDIDKSQIIQSIVDHSKDLVFILNVLESHHNLICDFHHHSSYFENNVIEERWEW